MRLTGQQPKFSEEIIREYCPAVMRAGYSRSDINQTLVDLTVIVISNWQSLLSRKFPRINKSGGFNPYNFCQDHVIYSINRKVNELLIENKYKIDKFDEDIYDLTQMYLIIGWLTGIEDLQMRINSYSGEKVNSVYNTQPIYNALWSKYSVPHPVWPRLMLDFTSKDKMPAIPQAFMLNDSTSIRGKNVAESKRAQRIRKFVDEIPERYIALRRMNHVGGAINKIVSPWEGHQKMSG